VSLRLATILVALRCTCSSSLFCRTSSSDHTTGAYLRCGLTKPLYSYIHDPASYAAKRPRVITPRALASTPPHPPANSLNPPQRLTQTLLSPKAIYLGGYVHTRTLRHPIFPCREPTAPSHLDTAKYCVLCVLKVSKGLIIST